MLPSFSRARIADLSLFDLFFVLVKLTFSEVGKDLVLSKILSFILEAKLLMILIL